MQRDAQAESTCAIAIVADPQRDEPCALLPSKPARGEQLARAHRNALCRHRAGKIGTCKTESGKIHAFIRSAARLGDTTRRDKVGSTGRASAPTRDARTPE